MADSINIEIDNEKHGYRLLGNVRDLLANSRLLFSLKRLRYLVEGEQIFIPFDEHKKISVLQELQLLFDKFSFPWVLSDSAKDEVSAYDREQRTFEVFSKKADAIRNDQFDDIPELVEDFKNFQKILSAQLSRTLYPLQLLSAFHMAFSQNACNFAVPGAGKTSIVYAAYAYLKSLPKEDAKHVDKLLVIGPLSSFAPWENEYEACFGKKVESQRLSGNSRILKNHKEQHLFSSNPAELTLIYHGGVNGLMEEIVAFLKKNKTMVVVDEAHRIKNPEGVWGKSVVEIAKEAASRVVLTGTPTPNGYEDIYNLFQYLYPYKYKQILQVHYDNLVEMTKSSSLESENVKNLIKNISPFFIRIKKDDLKLPPANDYVVGVEMDQLQREIYDFIETKYIRSFESNSTATVKDLLNKAKLIRLRQASTNPSILLKSLGETISPEDYDFQVQLQGGMPEEFQSDSEILLKIKKYLQIQTPHKFIKTQEIIESDILPKKGKVIVWTIFIQNAKQLQDHLLKKGISSKLLIGEVDQADRELIIKQFNDPENFDFQVIIANPFAVSESISLHKGCHNAIYLERDYNCSNFIQSKDRIHRYGLADNQKTNYYYIISKDSIDEVIDKKLGEKVVRMEKMINEDIPLFARLDDSDETDIIKALIENYVRRA